MWWLRRSAIVRSIAIFHATTFCGLTSFHNVLVNSDMNPVFDDPRHLLSWHKLYTLHKNYSINIFSRESARIEITNNLHRLPKFICIHPADSSVESEIAANKPNLLQTVSTSFPFDTVLIGLWDQLFLCKYFLATNRFYSIQPATSHMVSLDHVDVIDRHTTA